jgi:hypothetical protein
LEAANFLVEAPLSILARRNIQAEGRRLWNAEIRFKVDEGHLDQHLDVGLGVALAGMALQIIGLLVTLSDRHAAHAWTLDRIKQSVRDEAVKALGRDELENLTYHDVREFLDGRSSTCRVTAEVDDELYIFGIFKDGPTMVVRYEP